MYSDVCLCYGLTQCFGFSLCYGVLVCVMLLARDGVSLCYGVRVWFGAGLYVVACLVVLTSIMALGCVMVWLMSLLWQFGKKPEVNLEVGTQSSDRQVEEELGGCFGGVDPPYLGLAWLVTTTGLFRLTGPTGFMSTLYPYLLLPIRQGGASRPKKHSKQMLLDTCKQYQQLYLDKPDHQTKITSL